jgi:carbon storage regulator
MLVLSRRQHQRIRLGDSIVITVVRVSGDKVRLGIEAPKNMLILRDELDLHEPASQIDSEQACTHLVEVSGELRAAS